MLSGKPLSRSRYKVALFILISYISQLLFSLPGNPIASQHKGLHPILLTELVERGKEVTVTESSLGEKAKKRANKLSVITAMSAPLKINETLPPLPAKRLLPLTLNRDVTNLMNEREDMYSQSSSVTPVSQARTYPGPSPQGSGTSLLPSLPARERRPCTVVTGKSRIYSRTQIRRTPSGSK